MKSLVVLGALAEGCGMSLAATGGYVTTVAAAAPSAGASIHGHLGYSARRGGSNLFSDASQLRALHAFHVGVSFRMRFAQGLTQVAAGPEAALRYPALVSPYGRLGVNLVQFESNAGSFGFGMFSPWAELGLGLCPDWRDASANAAWCITASGLAGYDLRFTSQPGAAYVGALAGVTILTAI